MSKVWIFVELTGLISFCSHFYDNANRFRHVIFFVGSSNNWKKNQYRHGFVTGTNPFRRSRMDFWSWKGRIEFFLASFFWKDSAKQIEAERWENAQRGVWHHSYTFEWYSVKCSKRKNPLEWESPCSNVYTSGAHARPSVYVIQMTTTSENFPFAVNHIAFHTFSCSKQC